MKNILTLKNLIKMSTILLVFLSSTLGFSQNIVINTNTIWNAAYFNLNPPSFGTWDPVNNILTLNASVPRILVQNQFTKLRIENITIRLNQFTHIQANIGTSIEIESSILEPSGSAWNGIVGLGNPLTSQFKVGNPAFIPEVYEAYNALTEYQQDQTQVSLNNSTIRKALYGIEARDGAILTAKNSVFIDCHYAVKIENYIHNNMSGKQLSRRNASYLENTNFITNLPNPFPGGTPSNFEHHVQLRLINVHGVNVMGCHFHNVNGVDRNCLNNERGIAIQAEEASFVVRRSGLPSIDPLTQCVSYNDRQGHIIGFSKGIETIDGSPLSLSLEPWLVVDNVNFLNNTVHLDLYKNERTLIRQNNFELNDNYISYFTGGTTCDPINMIKCEENGEFVIEQNSFSLNFNMATQSGDLRFIYLNNNGSSDNLINLNTFTNLNPLPVIGKAVSGVLIENDNSELKVWCNTFNEIRNGIVVEANASVRNTWQKGTGGDVLNQFNGTIDRTLDLVNNRMHALSYKQTTPPFLLTGGTGGWNITSGLVETPCAPSLCTLWPINVSINKLDHGNLIVFPNPAKQGNKLTIEHKEPGLNFLQLSIFTIDGKWLYSSSDLEEGFLLPSHISFGTYIIEVKDLNQNRYYSKLMVQ